METLNSLDLTAITWRLHSLTDVLLFMRSMKNKNSMRVVNNASNYYTEEYKKRLLSIDYNKHFRIIGTFTTPLVNCGYICVPMYNIIMQIKNYLDSMPERDSSSINKWKCYIITLEVLFKYWYENWCEIWENMRKIYSYQNNSGLLRHKKENIFWKLVGAYGNVYLFIKDICPKMFKIQNDELQKLFGDDNNNDNNNNTEKNLKRWNKMINSASRSDFYPFIFE